MASKPVLRNLLMSETKVNFVIALTSALVVSAAYKFGVEHRRKRKIDEFFKTYDAEAAFERMQKAGVFRLYNPAKEE
ncbi:unnamed protein product [Candidula unifasciata]|uniref:Mitochondrial cytochrome c oxidase subunit VIc/VIIs domain-containing protein n=1 Tax=Candidula unifasciata TaxID=100452 RepID=A0A8S3ZQM8_9EUPU|nr:unnamed protein product [Candidula unifasciata]